jgi:hypothetical protein
MSPTMAPTSPGSAIGMQTGVVLAIGERLGGEGPEHVLGGGAAQPEAVHAVAVVDGQADLDGGHGRDRAADTDERPGVLGRRDGAQGVVEAVLHQAEGVGELLWLRRIVVQLQLGEPHGADVHGIHTVGRRRPDGELGGAAADVDDEEGPLGRVEGGHGALERQPGLLVAGQELGRRAEDVGGGGEEGVPVSRVSGRRGGDDPRRLHAVPVEHITEVDERRQRPLHRRIGQFARAVDAFAEPRDDGAPLEVAPVVHDEEADGVGADVDGGPSRHRRAASRSATHRPTGSSPPARYQA